MLRHAPAMASVSVVPRPSWRSGTTLGRLYDVATFARDVSSDESGSWTLEVEWSGPDGGVGQFPLAWVRHHHGSQTRPGHGGVRAILAAAAGAGAELDARFGRPVLLSGDAVPSTSGHGTLAAELSGSSSSDEGGERGGAAALEEPTSSGRINSATVRAACEAAAGASRRMRSFDLGEVARSDEALWEASVELASVGSIRVTGCGSHGAAAADGGDTDDTVSRVARRLGWAVQTTLYGETFTVEATADPINAAYSPCFLEGHQDLAYYESPPGLQLLHCTRFDDGLAGGESVIVDAVAAAEALRACDPRSFVTLASVPVTLQKIHYSRERPAHMLYRRPAVAVAAPAAMGFELGGAADDASDDDWARAAAAAGPVTTVSWAPPFEGALRVPHPSVAAAHSRSMAALGRVVDTMARNGVGAHCERLPEGTMLAFSNRRMLHGRMSFGPDAQSTTPVPSDGLVRRLRGAYVNIDDFQNRLETLCSRFGGRGVGAHPSNGTIG